jgi:hypothetical protein
MKNKLNNLINLGVFDQNYTQHLDNYNFANLFNVINKGKNSYFNLCRSIYFDTDNIDGNLINIYEIAEGDTWTNISYRYFGTIKLWWLICKFNNIKNPFDELEAGKIIKIPTKELMETIINIIQSK